MSAFFTDRDLGHQFPELLRKAGIQVERHDDHFGPDTPDETWLRAAGRRGWFVLTHDQRIRYKPNERDAVMHYGVGLFVLVGHAPHRELARNFIDSIRAVERFIAHNPRPFIAKVRRPPEGRGGSGVVEAWLTGDQWKKGKKARRR